MSVDPAETVATVRAEIFDRHGTGYGSRFTQDSPILPDVWLAYAAAPLKPRDLLLKPCWGERTGSVTQYIRELVRNFRRNTEPDSDKDRSVEVAHVPGLIVARLSFVEMMRVVLPSTRWWQDTMTHLDRAFDHAGLGFADRPEHELLSFDQREHLTSWLCKGWRDVECPSLAKRELFSRPTETERASREYQQSAESDVDTEPPLDFLKIVRLAGLIAAAAEETKFPVVTDPEQEEEEARRKAAYFAKKFDYLYDSWPADPKQPPAAGTLFNVTLNRRAEAMAVNSTETMKADAGNRLFDISCAGLKWAIVDSGIDSSHPAFIDWDKPDLPPGRRDNPPPRSSRVLRTFEFRDLRYLLAPDFLDDLHAFIEGGEMPVRSERWRDLAIGDVARRLTGIDEHRLPANDLVEIERDMNISRDAPDAWDRAVTAKVRALALKRIDLLRQRIEAGLETDWAAIEPLIEDYQPMRPPTPHGTQVAGILSANWQKPGEHGERDTGLDKGPPPNWEPRATGVCPDIRLLDLRVLSPDGEDGLAAHDFEVISALKFLTYLNSQAKHPYVHGVNLSVSIPHEVTRYGCGSTPICEECERLVSSGMVVVAAAGNSGYADENAAGPARRDGYYRSGTITDPGNAEAVITVGSTHRHSPHQYGVSYFSSRGPTGDGRRKPDLVAPGEKVYAPSPGRNLTRVDGTSFAAPHVSGAAAMLMARHTELIGRPERIKEILCTTATDLGREPYYQGAGMLDVLRALQSI